MAVREPDNSLGEGVYYDSRDYIGLWPRIAILLIDGWVIFCWLLVLSTVWVILVQGSMRWLLVAFLVGSWLYMVALKRTRFGTLGYFATGCQLVTLRGLRPSLFRLTARSGLLIFSWLITAFDWLWCGLDDNRQALRDRIVGTCLVRRKATPRGTGNIRVVYYFFWGYVMALPQVRPKIVSSNIFLE